MTAVEFLIEQLKGKSNYITWNEIFEQAKEMEKQQIIDAYNIGFNTPFEINFNTGKSITSEDYYKEKFKKK